MSIISVTENFTGLTAEDQVESDGRIAGSGVRFFDVVFSAGDTVASRPFIAKADGNVPQLGDAHPSGAWIYVVSRRVVVTAKSPFVYRVTVQYKEVPNPLDEWPVIEWTSVASSEVILFDIDGKAIANSSDEPVDPPHTEPFHDVVLRARYNVASFNPVTTMNYKDAINSDSFLGFAAGLAKVMTYTSREIRAITGNFYDEVTVEIQFRKDGWVRQFVDEGFRTKNEVQDGEDPTYTEITDDGTAAGKPISEPMKLDGKGQKLKEGQPDFLITYETKKPLPFNTEFSRIA